MQKKLMIITAMVLALVFVVSGMGLAKETLTIYWNSNHDYDTYKEYIKEFEEKHDVVIEKELFLWPDMSKRLQTEFFWRYFS